MAKQMLTEEDAMLVGQANIWQHIYGYVESMALKCAVDLRIADIINSQGGPMTVSQIAGDIASPSLDLTSLSRLMRFLAQKNIFDPINSESENEDTLYTINHTSKWLLHEAELSLAPLVLMCTHPSLLSPLTFLSQCIEEGGSNPFKKAHGLEMFDFAALNPEFNRVFNQGMACTARITTKAVISEYKDGFGCIGSLVDVGGGTGSAVAEIVKAYPHIKGVNLDLPHVVATAPMYNGVSHVEGDMFKDIPHADAVLMKWIMHNWSDEDCIKILKNCRKAIPEKSGKVIIVDVVLQPGGDGVFDDIGMVFDIVMLLHFSGGKERTEMEWKKVLEEGGFSRYKIIKIPALQSIIEAYAE